CDSEGLIDQLVVCAKGRALQMNRGANVASGRWLLFLHADTVLSSNWVQAFGAHINSSDKAAYCNLAFDQTGFMAGFVAAWANFRSRFFGLPYGDQTLLISRKHYNATGGYRDIALMEDVAMARAIGRRKVALPVTATTNADSYTQVGWLKRGRQNLGTLLLYFLGRDPDKLAKRYTR
ncbi:MAG: glycosyl transferase, partial [Rhodobacteraceae bacterium]